MIALIEDLDQQKVANKSKTNSKTPKTVLGRLPQALTNLWAAHRQRKKDKIALHQLMQLDDALLKDIGLSRYELMSVRSGSLTFDSLVKQNILSNRDNACSTASLRK